MKKSSCIWLIVAAMVVIFYLSKILNIGSPYFNVFISISVVAYLVYIHPKAEKRKKFEQNKIRIIGTIEGLYLSSDNFHLYDVQCIALHHLERGKSLPSNEETLAYTSRKGRKYYAFPSDTMLFSVICVLLYAHSVEDNGMIEQYERMLETAGKETKTNIV